MDSLLNASKYRCIGYYYEGKKIADIAKILDKNYMTIKRWISKFKETGDLIKDKPRSGRPTKFSKRVEASIKRMLHSDPALTYKQVSQKVTKGIKKISKSAIGRYLKQRGNKYLPKNLSILSHTNKLKRIELCEYFLNNPLKNIIFSDEVKFDLNHNRRRFYKFKGDQRRARIRFNPNYSIMVWGAVSMKGRISLCEVEGTQNQFTYIDMLSRHFMSEANAKHGSGNWIFQQDNARAHTAKRVTKFFEDQGIVLLKHPTNSPDLNPIETVWSFLKESV
jgi:transposase